MDGTSTYIYHSFRYQIHLVVMWPCSLLDFCGLLSIEAKKFHNQYVQDKRLFTQWGAIPQQHHSSTSQATQHPDDIYYNQVPVTLQALLYMAKARNASVLKGDKKNNE